MLAHEFLGAGDGMQAYIDEILKDGDELLAAGYTHYPEGAISVPEGNRQVAAIVWREKGVLNAIVSQATLDYCPGGDYDSKTVEAKGDDVTEITVTDDPGLYHGDYYQIAIGGNEEGVQPANYLVWKPDKPVVSPLGFLAIK